MNFVRVERHRRVSRLQLYTLGTGALLTLALVALRFAEARHHERVATTLSYSAIGLGVTTVVFCVVVEALRRTSLLRSYVGALLVQPAPDASVRDLERLYAQNSRTLLRFAFIDPKLLDVFHEYIGAPMSLSAMEKRYPNVGTFWGKSMEYNAECANTLMRRYVEYAPSDPQENARLMRFLLAEMRKHLDSDFSSLSLLCNVAYIAVHCRDPYLREQFRLEYLRWRVTDKEMD